MTDLFFYFKKLHNYLALAFGFCAILLIVINILSLFNVGAFQTLYQGVSEGVSAVFSVLSALLLTYYICKNGKKAIASGACTAFFDLALYSLCSVHISFAFSIVLALLFSYVFKKNKLAAAALICFAVSLVLALIIGLSKDLLYSSLRAVCLSLKGRGAVFGAVNNLYSLLFSNNLSKLFFYKDYSGTALYNGEVVSGVLNCFKAQGAVSANASKYLAGKYFVNFFISTAIFLLLFSRLGGETQTSFLICWVLSVIFGDIRLLCLFVLLYDPVMYAVLLLLTSISYLTARLLDISLIYFREGSIFEFIKYRDKPIYFFLAGLALAALSYFAQSIILSKFAIQSEKFLPYEVRRLVAALGGERNIERINTTEVVLNNSNLVDILKLDCVIRGNTAELSPDDIQLLKKFL